MVFVATLSQQEIRPRTLHSVDKDRLERILDLLRQDGGRITTARRAVVTALVATDDHRTADELAESVQAGHPDVHRSTVYRTLDALERLGVVVHTHLGHGGGVYHLADQRHQHLVCESCGRITEVPERALDPLVRGLQKHYGFAVHAGHFALMGVCADCRARHK
jgi:Fur family ferric uptake transcriptional regulator